MTELSDAEVFGAPKEMSDAEVFGRAPEPSADLPASFLERFNAGAAAQEAERQAANRHPSGLDLLSTPEGRTKLWSAVKAYPQHFLESTLETLKTPGDVYSGKVDLGTDEGMDRALGLGTLVGLGRLNKLPLTGETAGMALRSGEGIARITRTSDGQIVHQPVGDLPQPQDFTNAAKVLDSPHAEANLKRMWNEDGVHPAEAVHDAERDAFLKHEITNGQATILKPIGAEGEVYLDAGKAVVSGTPRGDYISKIASGDVKVPTTEELGRAIKATSEGEKKFALASGFTAEQEARMRVLNRRIDEGGVEADIAIAEKKTILDTVPDNGLDLDIADIDSLKQLRTEFGSLEKSSIETQAEYEDGLARVLKRYVSQVIDGDDFAKAVFAKAFQEAKKNDVDTKLLSNETMNRFLGDLSEGDAAFMREQFAAFSRPKLPKPQEPNVVHIPAEDFEALTETGGRPGALSAAATEPGDIPLAMQPASPPGSLAASFKNAADTLFDMGRDAQMLVAPMARGTTDSMAIAKDFANALRRNRWDWDRIDSDIAKRFTPEQRARMWTAADEESVSRQLEEPAHMREHQGLATLEPAERAAVDELQARAQNAWVRARDVGMVEGEGLPAYTPRMIINTAGAGAKETTLSLNGIGGNLRTKTANMLKRKYLEAQETEAAAKAKYGDQAMLARDIRVLPLATSQLEDAIAGRTLINNIKDYGARTGTDTVVEGAIPTGSDTKWFTLDHPAFRTWRPKFAEIEGKVQAVKDAEGNTIFEQVPLYVHGDFEGPLRAVLSQKSGPLYGGMMALKGKTMSLIMNSPMIHNAVEWGRALPAMPGKVATFKVYFEGNRAKNDVAVMHEAIDNGLVPVGHRFFNQDISGLMESPDLTPGRSWTAKVLAAVPGLFDEAAGTAVKRAIDKAGNFWHNTLLWDRVADLQMGLYVNMRADAIAKGIDPQTSSRMAAHWANRYAGALPKEAMSDAATKVANMLLFSRSFTMGNLGVIKDMFTGLPKDVLAQIERDAGFGRGSIEAADETNAAVSYAKSMARRKAMAIVAMDMGLLYIGNSLLQNAMNVMLNDSTLDKELHGYATRFLAKMQAVKEHPLQLIQPLRLLQDVSSTSENEPSKGDRIHVGNAANGTAIYMRNPAGKIGEEFIGYMTGPLDMMRRKLGTIARPVWQIASNDAGFGRKVYDPDADTPGKYLKNLGLIAGHLVKSQFPEGQIGAFSDLVKGEGDKKVNMLQAFGPFGGVTFSKGAPGGPAVGEMYAAKAQHEFAVNQALPDIRRMIQRGDVAAAQDRMMDLDIPLSLQRFYIRTTLNPATRLSPRATRDFYLHATPEQRARFDRALQAPPPP